MVEAEAPANGPGKKNELVVLEPVSTPERRCIGGPE